jgi:hypothetical protein
MGVFYVSGLLMSSIRLREESGEWTAGVLFKRLRLEAWING